MAFESHYGITQIRDENQDNLSISFEDRGVLDDQPGHRIVGLLFTPDMDYPEIHYHIELDHEQASALRDWLSKYFAEAKS